MKNLPDMRIKTQCDECKHIFTGIGDNICPNCEGELHEIENTNYSLKDEIEKMKNTDQPMSPNIDNFMQESLDKKQYCEECEIYLDYKDSYQCNNRQCPCHQSPHQEPVCENCREVWENDGTVCGRQATQYKKAEERHNQDCTREEWKENIEQIVKAGYDSMLDQKILEAKQEERQFILNVLDGIDVADKENGLYGMGVIGGTKAIRLALKSRII